MLAKMLGLVDFLVFLSIVLFAFGIGPGFVVVMAVLLLIKAAAFITSFASWIDILVAGVMLYAAFYGFIIVLWIGAVWLLQKAVVSWFAE